jgi:hypothetical protein
MSISMSTLSTPLLSILGPRDHETKQPWDQQGEVTKKGPLREKIYGNGYCVDG